MAVGASVRGVGVDQIFNLHLGGHELVGTVRGTGRQDLLRKAWAVALLGVEQMGSAAETG